MLNLMGIATIAVINN